MFCINRGKVIEKSDAPRRESVEKEIWYNCLKCGSIFGGDILQCPACRTENPLMELHFTIKEIVWWVWPDLRRIWTRDLRRFDGPVAEVRREKEAMLRRILIEVLEERARVLAVKEPVPNAVPV